MFGIAMIGAIVYGIAWLAGSKWNTEALVGSKICMLVAGGIGAGVFLLKDGVREALVFCVGGYVLIVLFCICAGAIAGVLQYLQEKRSEKNNETYQNDEWKGV